MWRRNLRNKFNNRKTIVDKITFDSKKEAHRYQELKILQKAKKIKNLKLQQEFILLDGFKDFQGKKHRPIKYLADFVYEEKNKIIVEDVKGRQTAVYKLKKKMFLAKYPQLCFVES